MTYVTRLNVYISQVFWLFKLESRARLVLMNWELSYIYVSELKVAAFFVKLMIWSCNTPGHQARFYGGGGA